MTRTIIVFISCVVSIAVWDNLDKFLAVVGALTCTPIAFTLPMVFYMKACNPKRNERILLWFLIVLSLIIMFFCTGYTFYTWNA
jgi:amino acid permease